MNELERDDKINILNEIVATEKKRNIRYHIHELN